MLPSTLYEGIPIEHMGRNTDACPCVWLSGFTSADLHIHSLIIDKQYFFCYSQVLSIPQEPWCPAY